MKKELTEEEKEIEKKIKNISNGYLIVLALSILWFIALHPFESVILIGTFIFSPFSIIALLLLLVLNSIVCSIAEITYKYYSIYKAIAFFMAFSVFMTIISYIMGWIEIPL